MVSFRHTAPGREGYAVAEVDAFVARIEDALTHTPPTMRPDEVHAKVFALTHVHAGYDEREVDTYLDEAEHRLRVAFGELDPPPQRGSRFGWLHAVGTAVIVLGAMIVALVLLRLYA